MSENMKPEDRLAEKLKNDTLGTFFSEEDLLPICRKAIDLAFFQPVTDRYGGRIGDAPIAAMAKEALEEEVKKYISETFSKLIEHQDFQKIVQDTLHAGMVQMMVNGFDQQLRDRTRNTLMDSTMLIKSMLDNLPI